MATVQQLQQWRERLLEARFSGVREVKDANGESVTYRSDAEISRALAALERELAGRSANTIHFNCTKGL